MNYIRLSDYVYYITCKNMDGRNDFFGHLRITEHTTIISRLHILKDFR